jgi:hypothetical protein
MNRHWLDNDVFFCGLCFFFLGVSVGMALGLVIDVLSSGPVCGW